MLSNSNGAPGHDIVPPAATRTLRLRKGPCVHDLDRCPWPRRDARGLNTSRSAARRRSRGPARFPDRFPDRSFGTLPVPRSAPPLTPCAHRSAMHPRPPAFFPASALLSTRPPVSCPCPVPPKGHATILVMPSSIRAMSMPRAPCPKRGTRLCVPCPCPPCNPARHCACCQYVWQL